MTCYHYLICIFLVAATADDTCGPNEVANDSLEYVDDCCPEAPGQETACPYSCEQTCKCDLMYKRAPNGTCIPSRECPPVPCNDKEVFESCPVCSEDCNNAVPSGKRCRFVGNVLTTVICEPACRCIDKYWRNKDGVCVPYEECPIAKKNCQD